MSRSSLLLFIVLLLSTSLFSQVSVTSGMVIHRTTTIKKSVYNIDAPADETRSVILIEGENIQIDFANATIKGSHSAKTPDEFTGTAIIIRNSQHVTIRNLTAKGFKLGIIAENVSGLTLENCDLSYNYRPHLNSTQEKEDISDWMSYHHNEKDEWKRYGAGIYLKRCDSATVRNCKVTGGQNALMMTESNDGLIVNNDFSFNSGIGIGMYRSNRNKILYNRIIFNVRGYSHGVYNRGQDSAGILVYEQSNFNWFFWNNVTHGGDGFFLWAGQTTMDTGEGGCNDNILYKNDFSFAPTNGIEVTFSRNNILGNIIKECDHGIWGGYSFNTKIRNNQFTDNRIAIAIEHGQNNHIYMNSFEGNKEAIRLWANKTESSDWGYPKHRDTRSRSYEISDNLFDNNITTFNFSSTDTLKVASNKVTRTVNLLREDGTLKEFEFKNNDSITKVVMEGANIYWPDEVAKAGKRLTIPDTTYAGRENIRITEWGPYDFRSPIIWNTNPTDTSSIIKFDLVGPKGKWKIRSFKGIKNISVTQGIFPASISAEKIISNTTDIVIEVEYAGESVVTPFGETVAAGRPYTFSFRKYFLPINWNVSFYAMDTTVHNPVRTGRIFLPGEQKIPVKTEQVRSLDYAWWGGIKAGDKQYPQFITMADAGIDVAKGMYEIGLTWDDAVRLYIDDKLVIDQWDPSKYTFDESPHQKIRVALGGKHRLRVEHLELGGFATLSLKIKPVE